MSEFHQLWHPWDEPACWLSDELPLLPPSWKNHLSKSSITLQVKNTKQKVKSKKKSDTHDQIVPLTSFTQAHWARFSEMAANSKVGPDARDLVIDEVEVIFNSRLDEFDIPLIPGLPYRNSGSAGLPFLTSTWELLESLHLDDEKSLNRLLGGTFLDLYEELGSVRAVLDISVTAQSWIDHRCVKGIVFYQPESPASESDFLGLMRKRVFRNGGLKAVGKHYTLDFADAVSRRLGVTIQRPWTLEQVGELLGLTRERVRQITAGMKHHYEPRRWPLPPAALLIPKELATTNYDMLKVNWEGELIEVRREDATRLLVLSGLREESLAPLHGIEARLSNYGLDLKTVRNRAYLASKRMGLVQQDLAVDNIVEEFEGAPAEIISEAISYVSTGEDLPFGYVLIEGNESCFLVNSLQSVLSKNGALPMAELYDGLVRFFKYRTSRLIFPPQRVVDALLNQDSRFIVENGEVRLTTPINKNIGESYEWMWQQIALSPGLVIHRAELLQRGRENGHNASTLGVYFSYSTYFKPVGDNCITLTGYFPKDEDVALAKSRKSDINVRTKVLGWSSKGSVVEVQVEVGNYMLDSGHLLLPISCRRIIGGKAYAIFWGDEPRGHVGWSSSSSIGWSSVLSFASVSPGDHVTLLFDLNSSEVFVAFSADLVEDIDL